METPCSFFCLRGSKPISPIFYKIILAIKPQISFEKGMLSVLPLFENKSVLTELPYSAFSQHKQLKIL